MHTSRKGRGAFLCPLLAFSSALCQAATFELDNGISGRWDNSLSAGLSVSTSNPDKGFIPIAYGGSAAGINGNDGRQNFNAGDTFSRRLKVISELALSHDNLGLQLSGKLWYDDLLENGNARFKDFDDSGFDSLATFSGAELMDAYVWGEFQLNDRPLDLRLGQQVLSWGESTFIQGGLNVINPIDANALTSPGVEIKEALIPVNLFNLSLGLSDNLSASAFYQLEWRATVQPGCGTFFAQSDASQPGCEPLYAVAGRTEAQQDNLQLVNPLLPVGANMRIPRLSDDTPSDGGQWGLRLDYFAEALNSTEFAFYAMNYHSRLPYLNAITADYSRRPGSGFFLPGVTNNPAYGGSNANPLAQAPQYQMAYPKDIRLYGLSFNTSGPWGVSLAGEISHRPNQPIAINGQDFLYASGFLDTESPIVDELFGLNITTPGSGPILAKAAGLYGTAVQGYRRKPVSQAQLTAIQTVSNIWGADNLLLVAEVGAVHVADLEPVETLAYGREAVYGSGVEGAAIACKNPALDPKYCQLEGYTTAWSWGYAARANLTYSSLLPGIEVTPSLAWRHDVNGNAPSPAPQFVEGRQAITLGLSFDYQNRYSAAVSYTDFFGGDFNPQTDRDFVTFTLGAKF
ncbi:Protein of unknown function [Atopomonas hussainii]|uniref:DUF1302 domain-containing protein n=1 Tax=Atopomonas hussainii TaxID=1429083 RepID=A0A1H7FH47_9GAMM|nr:DUF1302 domain-containing protein [Atopomonas hussainii]SEK22615.1 Protein of unknown function [Atopomonas hussainii]